MIPLVVIMRIVRVTVEVLMLMLHVIIGWVASKRLLVPFLVIKFYILLVLPTSTVSFSDRRRIVCQIRIAVVAKVSI